MSPSATLHRRKNSVQNLYCLSQAERPLLFPLGFEAFEEEEQGVLIKAMKQESEILSFFLAQMDVVDPDVLAWDTN